ncbi:MAG: hypothetical protein Q9223_007308, partial [Gallowayella weberi]
YDSKTRLVRQYIEQYQDSDTSVFWIHAGTAERMRSGSRDIAKEVGAQGSGTSNTDILVDLKKWFEGQESGKWLLIYDNVDDIDLMYDEHGGGLSTHFPRSNHGSIILTTRNRQIGVKFAKKNLITLSDLTQAQSISLMATRLGDETTESRPALSKLAEALGGIPLALVQATSFMKENHSTPDRYLELYEANESNKNDLQNQDFEDDTRDSQLKNPIAATWIVTFEHLKDHRPLAADALCLMSMFDTQAIPESLISKIAEGHSTSTSPTDMDRTLGVLQSYSLISTRYIDDTSHEKRRRSFDIHRLVRLVTRNWLVMCSTYDHWVSKAIDVMSARYDEIDELPNIEAIQGASELSPHAQNLLRNTIAQGRMDEANAIIDRIAAYHRTGSDKLTLAGFYRDTGRYDEAETLYLSLLDDVTALQGKEYSPDDVWNSLARMYVKQKFYSKAENVERQILAYQERVYGKSSLAVLGSSIYLGWILFFQAQYDEAEAMLPPLVDLLKQKGDELDWLVLNARWILARVWLNQKRVDESREEALEIISLMERAFGAHHSKYIEKVERLRFFWGINPDGTVFEDPDDADEDAQPEQVVETDDTDTAAEGEQVLPD